MKKLFTSICYLFILLFGIQAKAQTDYQIGNGTTLSQYYYGCPMTSYWAGTRQQYLFLASEMTAAGMTPGVISAIKWNIEAVNIGYTNYTSPTTVGNVKNLQISIGSTTATSLGTTAGSFLPTTNVVFAKSNYSFSIGQVVFNLATPFTWNGTDNIVLDMCTGDPGSSCCPNVGISICKYTTTPFNSVNYQYCYSGNPSGAPAGNDMCGSTVGYYEGYATYRPNTIFTCLPPCAGAPDPRTVVAPYQVCPNTGFSIKLTGLALYNLTYQWQYSYNGTSWSNFLGTVNPYTGETSDTITKPTYYRCKITCTNSKLSYTTPAWFVDIAPFYYCYCAGSKATATTGLDVGNVKVVSVVSKVNKLNNGSATPLLSNVNSINTYSGFQYTVPPVVIYRDTAYRAEVTQINSASSPTTGIAAMFIDYNRDGLFDTVTERVMNKAITSPTGMDSNTFVVPHNAEIGLTGLRVVLRDNGASEPCTGYTNGETEDYLAEIRYEPCSGPASSGIVEGDTSMCTGYDYVVYDTTYERRKSEVNRTWQVSADNVLWFNAPNGNNKDTLMRIFTGQPLYYRLRLDCVPSTDTTYSAPMLVNTKAGYKCYCFSQAIGGKLLDTSDIGAYSLAGYVYNDGGSHLMNAKATHKRQDHTDESPILIDVDSMYAIKVFHTMRNNLHADAKVTIFMDFNNNHQYDIPDERVYTGYTAVGNFTLIDYLNVPKTTILNTPTGMRVILNNDLSPNVPSDEACGTYTSGETEDYIVKFIQPFPASVNEIAGINNLSIYPNPTTNGKFRLEFNGTRNVEKVEITVLDVMGRKLKEISYQNNGNQFGTDIDLGNEAKGVYFVEVKAGADKRVERIVLR